MPDPSREEKALDALHEHLGFRPVIYKERYKDIVANKIVWNGDRTSVEIYGQNLDGENVWIWIHLAYNCEEVTITEDDPRGDG
jgi:hypothetical protein